MAQQMAFKLACQFGVIIAIPNYFYVSQFDTVCIHLVFEPLAFLKQHYVLCVLIAMVCLIVYGMFDHDADLARFIGQACGMGAVLALCIDNACTLYQALLLAYVGTLLGYLVSNY